MMPSRVSFASPVRPLAPAVANRDRLDLPGSPAAMAILAILVKMATRVALESMPTPEMSSPHTHHSANARHFLDHLEAVDRLDLVVLPGTRDHLVSLELLGPKDPPDHPVHLGKLETPATKGLPDPLVNSDPHHLPQLDAPEHPDALELLEPLDREDNPETMDVPDLVVPLETPVNLVPPAVPVNLDALENPESLAPLEAATTALQPVWPLDTKRLCRVREKDQQKQELFCSLFLLSSIFLVAKQ